jgi:enterochelin esterase-like enzyme
VSAANTDYCSDLEARRAAAETEEARERIEAALLACRLKQDVKAEEVEKALGPNAMALEVRGDNAMFFARSPGPDVMMFGTFTAPMERVAGTDLWASRFRMASLERGMLKFSAGAGGKPLSPPDSIDWRGPKAAVGPQPASELKGTIVKHTLWSEALQETRRARVYLPPGYSKRRKYKTLYIGDGSFIYGWMTYIEPLIERKVIPPIVVVGIEEGEKGIVEDRSSLGVNIRSADYLPAFEGAGDRFDRHMRFVVSELIPFVEKEYPLAPGRANRVIQGQSNSATFAREAALRHPDLFNTALAFSIGWTEPADFGPPGATRARFVLTAGYYEAPFYRATKRSAKALRDQGFDVTEEYLYAGHEPNAWAISFTKYLPHAFGMDKWGAALRPPHPHFLKSSPNTSPPAGAPSTESSVIVPSVAPRFDSSVNVAAKFSTASSPQPIRFKMPPLRRSLNVKSPS